MQKSRSTLQVDVIYITMDIDIFGGCKTEPLRTGVVYRAVARVVRSMLSMPKILLSMPEVGPAQIENCIILQFICNIQIKISHLTIIITTLVRSIIIIMSKDKSWSILKKKKVQNDYYDFVKLNLEFCCVFFQMLSIPKLCILATALSHRNFLLKDKYRTELKTMENPNND